MAAVTTSRFRLRIRVNAIFTVSEMMRFPATYFFSLFWILVSQQYEESQNDGDNIILHSIKFFFFFSFHHWKVYNWNILWAPRFRIDTILLDYGKKQPILFRSHLRDYIFRLLFITYLSIEGFYFKSIYNACSQNFNTNYRFSVLIQNRFLFLFQ